MFAALIIVALGAAVAIHSAKQLQRHNKELMLRNLDLSLRNKELSMQNFALRKEKRHG